MILIDDRVEKLNILNPGQSTLFLGQIVFRWHFLEDAGEKRSEESGFRHSSKWPPSSPRFPAPALACSAARISPTATHTASGRQLASYQGKWKHTLLHTPLLGRGERGEKNVPALIGQLTRSYVWNFSSELGWRYWNEREGDAKQRNLT